jgi:hypothetical protein
MNEVDQPDIYNVPTYRRVAGQNPINADIANENIIDISDI